MAKIIECATPSLPCTKEHDLTALMVESVETVQKGGFNDATSNITTQRYVLYCRKCGGVLPVDTVDKQ